MDFKSQDRCQKGFCLSFGIERWAREALPLRTLQDFQTSMAKPPQFPIREPSEAVMLVPTLLLSRAY